MIDLGGIYPAAIDVKDGVPVPGDPAGTKVNAATVTLTITQPDGTTVTPPVGNPPPVTGEYRLAWPPTMAGHHLARWLTLAPQTGYTDGFDVREPDPAMIVSLAAAKRQLGMDPGDSDDDEDLRDMICSITGAIEDYKNETIVAVTATTRQLVSGGPHAPLLRLLQIPVIALISVQTADSSAVWNVANLRVSSAGLVRAVTGPPIQGDIIAEHRSGYQIIPYRYREASKVLLQSLWESRRGPGGLSGVIGPEELADFRHYTSMPRKVMEQLGPPRPVVA